MSKILVVEDDLTLSAGLCFALDNSGLLTVPAYTCQKARQLLKINRFQLAILDVNLPDGSGFGLCREIKAAAPELPVIFLTANDLEQDQLNGFDLGADDYITKPFVPLEAVARVHSALRRFYDLGSGKCRKPETEFLETKTLKLDLKGCLLYRMGEKITLTSVEFRIMKLFMENPGKVFTKQQLFEQGWGEAYMLSDNNVMVCISKLRAKLDCGEKEYIRTIRSLGYRLEDEED